MRNALGRILVWIGNRLFRLSAWVHSNGVERLLPPEATTVELTVSLRYRATDKDGNPLEKPEEL